MNVELVGLSKTFGSQRVLDDLTLILRPGERVALVGPNGSGKTTLLRCLLGLYQSSGEARLGGRSPHRERDQALESVGFVPQIPPGLRARVRDFLRTVTRICALSPPRIAAVAARLGLDLERVSSRRFSELSGGMKQKLMIAIAIARVPSLLIMDEPGANLDPTSRAVFLDLLAELPGHTTMLLSSHRLDEIAALVTRVVELDGGRVVLDEEVAVADRTLGPAARRVEVELRLRSASSSFERALVEWGLGRAPDELRYVGAIPAGERHRFFALLTRHAGLVEDLCTSVAAARERRGEPTRTP